MASGGSRSVLDVSSFRFRARLDVSIPSTFSGQRGVTPAFGYGPPHSSARRTSTFLNNALLSTHYEPLRHPIRPGLSLTSCQLIHTAITAGTSRVAYGPLCLHAVANTPAGLMEFCSLVRFHKLRPSPKPGRVGSCINVFEACSAFTHVTACMLAKSPMRPSTPKASAASLPPPLLRLLPGGANQFPGGFNSRCGPSPFHGAPGNGVYQMDPLAVGMPSANQMNWS
jgi:hypothetical protein